MQKYTHAALSQTGSATTATHQAMGKIYHELLHQASIIAYADSFHVMAILTGILTFVALLMPKNNPHARKPSAASAEAH